MRPMHRHQTHPARQTLTQTVLESSRVALDFMVEHIPSANVTVFEGSGDSLGNWDWRTHSGMKERSPRAPRSRLLPKWFPGNGFGRMSLRLWRYRRSNAPRGL
jgi:hypothetical protein